MLKDTKHSYCVIPAVKAIAFIDQKVRRVQHGHDVEIKKLMIQILQLLFVKMY